MQFLKATLASCLLLSSATSWAEEAPEMAAIEDDLSLADLFNVKSTVATRTARTIEESPSIVTVFTKQQLRRLGVRRLDELLPHVPGFYEVSSLLGKNFAVRGVHAPFAQHFAVLIDGVATQDFLSATSPVESFSLANVKQVEIIRGPGSAVYGAAAMMAVINLVSEDGASDVREAYCRGDSAQSVFCSAGETVRFSDDTRLFAGVSVWGAAGESRTVDASEDILLPRIGQNISNGISQGENLTSPRGDAVVPVGKTGVSYDASAQLTLAGGWVIRFSSAREKSFLQRSDRQTLLGANEAQSPYYLTTRNLLAVEKNIELGEDTGAIRIKAVAAAFGHEFASQRISETFIDLDPIVNSPDQDAHTMIYGWDGDDLRVTLGAEYSVELPRPSWLEENSLLVGASGEYSVAYGYDQQKCGRAGAGGSANAGPYDSDLYECSGSTFINEGLTVDSFGNQEDVNESHLGDGDEWKLGAYVQHIAQFTSRVGLVTGGRVEYHPDFGSQFSPRLALQVPISKVFYAKAQYATAFFYPALLYRTGNTQASYSGPSDGTKITTQSVASSEVLLGARGKNYRVEVNAFHNQLSDFITYDVSRNAQTGRYAFSNEGDLTVVGAELSTLTQLLDGSVTVGLHGEFTKALASSAAVFTTSGELAGPSKFPMWKGGATWNYNPIDVLGLSGSVEYAAGITVPELAEATFTNVVGTDGQTYSSRSQSDYQTARTEVSARVYYEVRKGIEVAVDGTNLLNQRTYRHGSLLVPLLNQGRRVGISLAGAF